MRLRKLAKYIDGLSFVIIWDASSNDEIPLYKGLLFDMPKKIGKEYDVCPTNLYGIADGAIMPFEFNEISDDEDEVDFACLRITVVKRNDVKYMEYKNKKGR